MGGRKESLQQKKGKKIVSVYNTYDLTKAFKAIQEI